MRLLILAAATVAVVLARPETYKESEDFQYSKSSTDEGSKSGYYGAQRGNVGGNYERSHNMDLEAQKTMSDAIRHVEGDLGTLGNSNTGSVFTAANTRSNYRQGYHDLSNLQGRNFQDGQSLGSSSLNSNYQSHSSLHNAGSRAGYSQNLMQAGGHQGYQGYSATKGGAYNNEYNRQAAMQHNQAAMDSQFGYEQANSHMSQYSSQQNSQMNRGLVRGAPVKIILRPGTQVQLPMTAELQNTANTASSFDQNSINTDAEHISTSNLHNTYMPTENVNKNYESSFSYKKEWEKHNTQPAPLSNVQYVPAHSELVEDAAESEYHRSQRKGYQATAQNYAQHDSAYRANQQYEAANSDNLLATSNSAANTFAANSNQAPSKGYQSSYSYHKSWERQGDPYVIKPIPERLTASSVASQSSHQAHHYDSHASQSAYGQSAIDCEDEQDHHRAVRSYSHAQYEQQQELGRLENLGQQAQTSYGTDFGQQPQSENLEEFGQQAQTGWGNSEDLTQKNQPQWDRLEEQGQVSQREYGNLEDLTQQTQGQWGGSNFGHNNGQWQVSPQKPNNREQMKPQHIVEGQTQYKPTTTMFYTNSDNENMKFITEAQTQYKEQETEQFVQQTQNIEQETQNLNQETVDFYVRTPKPLQPFISSSDYANQMAQIEAFKKQVGFDDNTQRENRHEMFVQSHQDNVWEQSQDTQQSFSDWGSVTTEDTKRFLQNVWDKIDNLYGLQKNESEHVFGTNSYDSQHRSWQQSTEGKNDISKQRNNEFNSSYVPISGPEINHKEHVPTSTIKPFTTRNIGRGDIRQEDTFKADDATERGTVVNGKRYKTPKEIEALSLVKETDNHNLNQNNNNQETSEHLGVISLEQQRLNEQGQGHKDIFTSTPTNTHFYTQQTGIGYNGESSNNKDSDKHTDQQITQQVYDGSESNLEQQSQMNWQQSNNQETQNMWDNLEQQSDNTQQSQISSFGNEQTAANNFYQENINLKQQQESHQNIENKLVDKPSTQVPQEVTTKKPGFWKSAKDKVSSWFSSG